MGRVVFLPALLLFAAFASSAISADARFAGMLADGTRVFGPEVTPWHFTEASPKLGQTRLFDPDNPVRWLLDTQVQEAPLSESYVEFFGGDRLPGQVVQYSTGEENPYHRRFAYLVVTPGVPLDWPDRPREGLRISAGLVRKIVWQGRHPRSFRPATVFLLDGRQFQFRSFRMNSESIQLLTSEGVEQFGFNQLAELHFPRRDAWECYFEQLALLSPECSSRLMRLETGEGLIATSSMERFEAKAHGSHNPEHWLHMIQPAWSLDPLWVRHRSVRMRRYHAPESVPLSLLPLPLSDAQTEQESSSTRYWPTWRDRNVRGERLSSADQPYGWGFGTHAASRLEFPLPACATRFRSQLGLDDLVGPGGCARAIVRCGADAKAPLYRSDLLIGSHQVHDTGWLTLPEQQNSSQRQLVLIADAAHADRPAGADPLSIGDMLDWLESEVELELRELLRQVRLRSQRVLPAWDGWELSTDGEESLELRTVLNTSFGPEGEYCTQVLARHPLFSIRRRLAIGEEDRYLVLAVSRFAQETTPATLQVQLDGGQVQRFSVPERPSNAEPDPILVPVEKYAGGELDVELTFLPGGPKALLYWQAISLADHRPGLRSLLPSQSKKFQALQDQDLSISVNRQDVYSGPFSVSVGQGRAVLEDLVGEPLRIRERPRLGEYRYVQFAWKTTDGGRACLEFQHDERFGPDAQSRDPNRQSYRYDAGTGDPSYEAALRISTRPPEEWTLVTRDLYADFGEFNLTGLGLTSPDGKPVQFDHLHLGRGQQDFTHAPQRVEAKPK